MDFTANQGNFPTLNSNAGYTFWAQTLNSKTGSIFSKTSQNTPLQGAKFSKLGCQKSTFYSNFIPKQGQDFQIPVGPRHNDMSLIPPRDWTKMDLNVIFRATLNLTFLNLSLSQEFWAA